MLQTNGKLGNDIKFLEKTVQTALTLIQERCKTKRINSGTLSDSTKINALELAHDTALLIRAHSTNLSLLIINEPFSPSAVSKVLHELITSLIPSLLKAVELCDPKEYSQTVRNEIDFRVTELLAGMRCLINTIPLNGLAHKDDSQNTIDQKGVRNLTTIGTVWQSCDALVELKRNLIAGLFAKKAEEYKNLLKDALEELLEWAVEEDDVDDEDEIKNSSEQTSPQFEVDVILSPSKYIPTVDFKGIRPRLQATAKRLRLLTHMFQAVVKRRFKILPSLPNIQQVEGSRNILDNHEIVKTLDTILKMMGKISNLTDELAGSFYELDVPQIDLKMDKCFSTGAKLAELLMNNWQGQQDNFSVWVSLLLLTILRH